MDGSEKRQGTIVHFLFLANSQCSSQCFFLFHYVDEGSLTITKLYLCPNLTKLLLYNVLNSILIVFMATCSRAREIIYIQQR